MEDELFRDVQGALQWPVLLTAQETNALIVAAVEVLNAGPAAEGLETGIEQLMKLRETQIRRELKTFSAEMGISVAEPSA